jgi:hypothetical protein
MKIIRILSSAQRFRVELVKHHLDSGHVGQNPDFRNKGQPDLLYFLELRCQAQNVSTELGKVPRVFVGNVYNGR